MNTETTKTAADRIAALVDAGVNFATACAQVIAEESAR